MATDQQLLLADPLNRQLINRLQHGLPLCHAPYQALAEELGTSSSDILQRISQFLDSGLASRFGPMFQIERAGGAFTLVATHADEDDFDRVVSIINARHEVAHNYRRDHRLNIWFVLACERPQDVPQVLQELELATGCRMLNFPKEQEFHVQLYLPV
ncbi:AsnC family transcriptional regulator [Thalassolituus sp. LLYu03]|uniref:siroheme decarboxylase n=1 Tax=Thalassolituus marinus TaxID=671053 RepID=A0ABS7ZTH5_9GAMM|nr:AsnC family transcriptional regulator [Thalassolituus marinus]MCA6063710.1 AsnC family transcriptional regulator [Thalassolituus marinus]